ncbi:2-oxoacid:acceptor oxidoreductase subunit alpha [Nosocomiicoccus ampullae]|uniref:2-oxoglutarate ferredoxin oxidoreductase subunit alpha n=1 Tax=Nosocomiicoccus ampullae TaxID=489910 RepID=A0A9Q2D095_9STAP|nr:2-oxoacid:acceptor oxidoreductase subunit alpha [Nosocomiicoccus ampullae]MBB5176281.1 2-oxoglutarate ferredoxin oxidoreductase subunit alpha [Nosocomiicoccus ampullae]QYA47442.1 2-oxoacid:acceptor oxidoreductase subunit alpha [Nosocomiicoccus ampullae]
MISQLSWKVGGQQGEGIESTGEIFSTTLNRMGYYLYSYRHFSSRIKGGHTNNNIRISTKEVRSISDHTNILVAFDQETIDINAAELVDNGVILADEKFNPEVDESLNVQLISVPFTEIANEHGSKLMKNMVAVGASAGLMHLDIDKFKDMIYTMFARKGEEIVNNNIDALKDGFNYIQERLNAIEGDFELEKVNERESLYLIGNDAIGFGALNAGVRFMAAYPITPASDIMEYMIEHLPKVDGTVIQTEDEISAVTMAIGSNYAGARSFTSSSGPGLSLMMESIGLSGMTETPLVIVDTMRGGPSTGLPTKQEQSDLMQMIYGTHGEVPKIILAPADVEDAFYLTTEAFNLADKYQVPVILLSDLQMSLGKQSANPFDLSKVEIDRGQIITEDIENDGAYFERFKPTESGISDRPLPGVKGGIHHVTGVEHNPNGTPNESAVNRKEQMDKRMRKVKELSIDTPFKVNGEEESDLLVISFLSGNGAVDEAVERVGDNITTIHMRQLFPVPIEALRPYLDGAKKVLVVEQNYTGQLFNVLKMNYHDHNKMESFGKYDGTPLKPMEIERHIKQFM